MVSVVICFYSEIDFIAFAIESIVKQNFKNLEVLLIDDFSEHENELKNIISNYSNLNILYIRNEYNIGLARSRNKGIEASKGEYICFLDSDDEYLENKLNKQYKLITELNLDVVYHSELVKKKNKFYYRECDRGFSIDKLLTNQYINLNSLMISRHFIIKNNILFGSDEITRYGEDLEFLIKMSLKKPQIIFCDEYLSISRRRKNNHRNYLHIWKEFEKLDLLFSNYYNQVDFYEYRPLIKKKLSSIRLKKIIAYKFANMKKEFINHFYANIGNYNFKIKLLLFICYLTPYKFLFFIFNNLYLPFSNFFTYKRYKVD